MAGDPSVGELLKSYWAVQTHGDAQAIEVTLATLLPRLTGLGLQTAGELAVVLDDVVSGLELVDENDPVEVESEFRRLVATQVYKFRIPVGLTGLAINAQIGGRLKLQLRTDSAEFGWCYLEGTTEAAHWVIALRAISEVADELLGCLAAVGIAKTQRPFGEPPPQLQVQIAGDVFEHPTGERWSEEIGIGWKQANDIWMTAIIPPRDPSEIELAAERQPGNKSPVERRIQLAARPFRAGGMDAKRLRRAARFLRKAIASDTLGDSYLFMATCLEGLLVNGKGDLSARVTDAVSLTLGRTHAERKELRELATHLYDVRSRYVHEGEFTGDEARRMKCLDLSGRVLAQELRVLEDAVEMQGD